MKTAKLTMMTTLMALMHPRCGMQERKRKHGRKTTKQFNSYASVQLI